MGRPDPAATQRTPSLILRAGVALAAMLLAGSGAIVGAGENETFGAVPHPPRVDGTDRRTFEIPLERGRSFEDAVRIYNRTEAVVRLAIYPAEAVRGDDGVIAIGVQGADPEGLASWITVSQGSVELEGGSEIIVPFWVHVGTEAPSPDLAAIVVENEVEPAEGDVIQRIAILVRTAPPGTPTAATLLDDDARTRPWWIALILALVALLLVIGWKVRDGKGAGPPRERPVTLPPRVPDLGAETSDHTGPLDAAGTIRTTPIASEHESEAGEGEPDQPPEEPDQPAAEPSSKPRTPSRAKPRPKRPPKRNYIPLDEL